MKLRQARHIKRNRHWSRKKKGRSKEHPSQVQVADQTKTQIKIVIPWDVLNLTQKK